jgi:hypothetical protein
MAILTSTDTLNSAIYWFRSLNHGEILLLHNSPSDIEVVVGGDTKVSIDGGSSWSQLPVELPITLSGKVLVQYGTAVSNVFWRRI